MEDMKSVMSRIDKSREGVYVQKTTLGSLEALLEFLKTPRVIIHVSGIGIGPVHKKDVIKASVMLEKKKEYATILAFDVKVTQGARELSDELGVKVSCYQEDAMDTKLDVLAPIQDAMKGKIEELELKKKKQETKAIETSRKAIPSMEKCKKQLMIANSDFMGKMEVF
ncbi:hypothetical protein H5410_027241 [Solanum commersonii]|uniref:Translation initiation factor IF- 2 domain-containing protein n=1 Tax=Solanum commersonii TaxID=4109 RepID=A0A9J5Z0S3_SOLCO|nr:hypothetical protein H5410_027241 [Solanum commersonii]